MAGRILARFAPSTNCGHAHMLTKKTSLRATLTIISHINHESGRCLQPPNRYAGPNNKMNKLHRRSIFFMLLSTLASRSVVRSFHFWNTRVTNRLRASAFVSSPFSFPTEFTNRHRPPRWRSRRVFLRAYTDDGILQDDVQIYEEVESDHVEDIKHSSSMLGDTPDNNDDGGGGETNPFDNKQKRQQLKNELTQYRIDQAASLAKPAYNVFTNAALEGICQSLPTNDEALLQVKGIGPKKLELYGDDILSIVTKYTQEGGLIPLQPSSNNGVITSNHKSTSKAIPKPEPIQYSSLTTQQQKAANLALEGHNIFLSGPAGTGKSHVSKYILQTLQSKGTKVSPTAPTGVAAINIGGSTLHSFFGIGLGKGSVPSLVKKIRKSPAVVQRINDTEVLLIDEVSMLSCELLEKLDGVARLVRERDVVMGGLQIVAVGDFYQVS